MQSFLVALAFLTIIPIRFREMPGEAAVARSRLWYPVVGLLLGGLLAGWTYVVGRFGPPAVAAFLVLAAWVLVTGALHLDGFCDLCDGLFGGQTPEDRLRIMKEPTRGSFALVGCVLLLLGKYAAIAHLMAVKWANLAPVMIAVAAAQARCLVFCVAAGTTYPRKEGTGRVIVQAARMWEALAGAVLAGVITLAAWSVATWEVIPRADLAEALWGGTLFTCLFLVPALFAVVVLRVMCERRLGGVTGDCLGAAIELAEVVFLLGAAFVIA